MNHKLYLIPLLIASLISFTTSPAWAIEYSSDHPDVRVPGFWEMITDIPSDLKLWGQDSTRKENLGVLLGVAGMTAITVATDFETWQAARIYEREQSFVGKLANQGVSMGDGFFQFGIVGGFAAAGFANGDRLMLRTASQITESILATGIVVQVIKHISGRESPFSSESRTGVWRVFPNQAEYMKDFQKYDAVPSGHLSTAVTTLVVIQENFPDQRWISYVGWPVMGWIGYGLVGTSIHWWSDFPIAAAIGYSMAKIVTAENRRKPGMPEEKRSVWRPMILPTLSSEGQPVLMARWMF